MGEPFPERVKEIFNQAVDLPASERTRFLEAACGADEMLRRRVEELLYALDDAGSFLDSPTRTSSAGFRAAAGVTLAAGSMLGPRYRIVRAAGRGAMGEVYRAEDLELGQTVALKLLPDEFTRDPDRLARLRDEVRIARQVSHPNVCRVYDIGEAGGRQFLTMEWIDGEDLAILLARTGTPAPDRTLSIARQVAAGLAAVHERGVVHRDLKPSNVMVDERGVARITDFGLADLGAADRAERSREGTPRYMSPEQFAGEHVTFQSDLYALGLLLYELFTGQRVYRGNSLEEIAHERRQLPPPPSRLAPGIDPAVEHVILRCLDLNPSRRPSGARAVVEALPGAGDTNEALLAAQRRADRIGAFRAELSELRQAGLLDISNEALQAIDAHHDRVFRDLMQRFDVDVTERGKQLSLGMRAVSLVAAVALAASVYYAFYRVWGAMATSLQVAVLAAAPMVALLMTSAVARRERGGYFTLISALAALSAAVVGSALLGATFNLTPSPVSVLTWGLFALVLAYGFGLRFPLIIGVVLSSTFVAGTLHHLAGGMWGQCLARPESFLPAGLLVSGVALIPPRHQRARFSSTYGGLAVTLLAVPPVALAMVGQGSYLPFDTRTIEGSYQLVGFVLTAGAIWLGVVTRRREVMYGGTFFFVTLLFLVFFKWWWNWMPRYLFFLLVALAAVGVMLALKRLRAGLMARWTEVAS